MDLHGSFGVDGPTDCPLCFCLTSLIFNCKLCLVGKMSLCNNWNDKIPHTSISHTVPFIVNHPSSVLLPGNCLWPGQWETNYRCLGITASPTGASAPTVGDVPSRSDLAHRPLRQSPLHHHQTESLTAVGFSVSLATALTTSPS